MQAQASQPNLSQPRLSYVAWLLVPTLAVIAYAPVLSLWFVGDDFGLLLSQERRPWPEPFLAFRNGGGFYRPLSTSLTWELGTALFGTNALPYHILSLSLHALASLLLGHLVATITSGVRTGWLAGALFAVYPLCIEPVAWLASQWDAWAGVCVLGAVWGFAVFWKTKDRRPYIIGLVAALLGVFMKESALPLPLTLPFVALATELTPRVIANDIPGAYTIRQWFGLAKRAVLWSIPYAAPTLLFVSMRLLTGGIGGYPGARTDYQHLIWDNLVVSALQMLMPLNRDLFSPTVVQLAGLSMTLILLTGLVAFGKRRWPLLLLALVWWIVFLLPAINLVGEDYQRAGNRVYYLSLMALCMTLAAILLGLVETPVARKVGWGIAAIVLLLAIPATWTQLQPWQQSSRQTRHLVEQMGQLLPPLTGRRIVFNTVDLPAAYQGSFVFLNGFREAMQVFNNTRVLYAQRVEQLDGNVLAAPFNNNDGIYNIAFSFDESDKLYDVTKIRGATVATDPPAGETQVWDYSKCDSAQNASWQPDAAQFTCASKPDGPPAQGQTYRTFDPASTDGKLLLNSLNIDLTGYTWLRLGVCARLRPNEAGHLGEWFWQAEGGGGWNQDRSSAFDLNASSEWRVYWTYVPVSEVGGKLMDLRFDPVNDQFPVDISWMSLGLVR